MLPATGSHGGPSDVPVLVSAGTYRGDAYRVQARPHHPLIGPDPNGSVSATLWRADPGSTHGHSARRHDPGCLWQADDFAGAFKELQAIAQREAGCEQYEAFQSLGDPEKVVLLERWASQELLDKHMEAERTRNCSAVDALVALWATGTTPSIERFAV